LRWVMAVAACLMLSLQATLASTAGGPMVIVYTPTAPDYGEYLGSLIEGDGRFDAEILVLTDSRDFNLMMHHPRVKAAVVGLNSDGNQNIGITLEWFFRKGGGMVGLGFAGSGLATGMASEVVFPIFANAYQNGEFDRDSRAFKLTHLKREEDVISEGLGDFTVSDAKLVLSVDPSSKEFVAREPTSGDYRVLYVDSLVGAPTVVKFQDGGVSVTFAGYAAVDSAGSFGYYGKFADSPEFRALFRNALHWVWTNERKYAESMEFAGGYAVRRQEDEDLRKQAEERERKASTARLIQMMLTISVAGAAVLGIYWVTFVRAP